MSQSALYLCRLYFDYTLVKNTHTLTSDGLGRDLETSIQIKKKKEKKKPVKCQTLCTEKYAIGKK